MSINYRVRSVAQVCDGTGKPKFDVLCYGVRPGPIAIEARLAERGHNDFYVTTPRPVLDVFDEGKGIKPAPRPKYMDTDSAPLGMLPDGTLNFVGDK